MPLVSTEAVVLHTIPYGETSRIVRAYTREHGLRSLIARGAIRPKSRFGLLEPFTSGTAEFMIRPGQELLTLTRFDLLRSRQTIGSRLTAYAAASLVSELVMRFGTEDPSEALFDVLSERLNDLAEQATGAGEGLSLAAIWSVICLLGFTPALDECVVCDRPIPADEECYFDPQSGGVICAGHGLGRRISTEVRTELGALVCGITVQPRDAKVHYRLITDFLAAHLESERPLRSLAFLSGGEVR